MFDQLKFFLCLIIKISLRKHSVLTFELYDRPINDSGNTIAAMNGSETATNGEFPFLVGIFRKIYNKPWSHLCSGTIIQENTVLTAASCFKIGNAIEVGSRFTFVVAGNLKMDSMVTEGAQKKKTIRIYIHNEYGRYRMHVHDLALVMVASSFVYNEYVYAIKLNDGPSGMTDDCFVLGWGIVDSKGNRMTTDLMSYRVNLINQSICKQNYGYLIDDVNITCSEGLRNNEYCFADGGSPLVCGNVLRGVLSNFGGSARRTRPCTSEQYYEVYVDVHYHEDWIKQMVFRNVDQNTAGILHSMESVLILFIQLIFIITWKSNYCIAL